MKRKTLTATEKLTLEATPPFDFDLSAKIFADGDKQIANYENGKFWLVIRVDGKLILVAAEALGTVDEPGLSVELKSNEKISDTEKRKAEEIVCALFNVDFDLKPFYEEARKDKIMADLTQQLRGLKSPTTSTVFEALIDSIIEQQISLNVANGMENRLIRTFGDSLQLEDETYYAFPTPQKLGAATIDQLRQCGLSQKKAEYIKEISKSIAEGKLDLEKFKSYKNNDEIIRELDNIRGIGVWTAELTMVRGMQKLEAMPADDLGLRRVISHYYCQDRKITGEEARKIAEKWGKWKGLASYYLMVASMLKVEN